MNSTKRNPAAEAKIEAALVALKQAQQAHADCLKWSYATMRIEPIVDDATLDARYAAVIAAEKAYARALRAAGYRA